MTPDDARAGDEAIFKPGSLLEALVVGGVDFVLIGGIAGTAHGSAYVTEDLDITYARDHENLERLAAVLHGLGAHLRGPNLPDDLPFLLDAKTLDMGQNFTFTTKFGDLDVLGDVSGAPPYTELCSEAESMTLFGAEVRIASLPHLMCMKRAAGRDKDKLHITEYAELLKLKGERSK